MNCQILSPCTFYLACTLLFLYLLYKLSTIKFNLERKYGFKGPKPLPLLGNVLEFSKHGFHVKDVENQKKYGHIYPVYMGQQPQMVISDDSILKQMLVKDAKLFIDRPTLSGSSKVMKSTLVRLKGKDWERVRTLLTPTFTSGKLKKMSPMIVASIEEMVKRFSKAQNQDIDVKEQFGSLTMDVIAKTMFGIEIDVSKTSSHAFIVHAKKLFTFSFSNILVLILAIFPQLTSLVEYLYPNGITSPESMIYLEKSLNETIKFRKNTKEEYHDFLTLMLKAHHELEDDESGKASKGPVQVYKGLTETEIMAQSLIFLLAGFETTASTLTFTSYYLAKNQDTQEEVYRELMENLAGKEEITYDMLSNLNLLEQCISETLRICPPAPRIGRICTKDTMLISSTGQVMKVKKGMVFTVPIYAIHHDERIWPNPDAYDIHRFDQNLKQTRSAYSYLPFGTGPRQCIGMRFALLEAKLALAHLLKNFKIVPCGKTPTKLVFGSSGLTQVKEPVVIRIEKR